MYNNCVYAFVRFILLYSNEDLSLVNKCLGTENGVVWGLFWLDHDYSVFRLARMIFSLKTFSRGCSYVLSLSLFFIALTSSPIHIIL